MSTNVNRKKFGSMNNAKFVSGQRIIKNDMKGTVIGLMNPKKKEGEYEYEIKYDGSLKSVVEYENDLKNM